MNAVSIIGVVAAFCLVFLWLRALCAEKGVHPLRRVRKGFRRLPGWKKALILIFVSVWIAFAGTKDGTNGVDQVEGGTNTVTQVEGGTNVLGGVQGRARIPAVPQSEANGESDGQDLRRVRRTRPTSMASITNNDIAQLWRIGTTVDVNSFAEPTANAVTNTAWLDYGGMSDTFRLLPEGWRFPFAEKTTSGLTVFENGEFRPNVKTHFFPPPFDAKLSLLPRMNWGVLPNGGESVFWHEQTPSNSLVLTWHNALYNRDVNCPTNFQAELFADGRFDYRYPDRTVQYAPVFPFDWDGDGLENSVDPDPLVAGPDAHGTNAEWYNRVCGNVFAATQGVEGVELAPRAVGVNMNAYYFVDVVAESLAPIYFVADGGSDLGSPVVIANAGEANRVPLLIGLEYTVTSSVPFSVSCANAPVVLNRMMGGMGFSVKWPVSFSFSSCGTDCNQVSVRPSCLNGVFSWTDGCCIASSGNVVAFTCSGGCSCGGCSAGGTYSYCGASLSFSGGGCGCGGSGGGPGHSETNSVTPELSLSMCLDHDVILFENAYTNRPGEIVARRSTFVCVQLAYGNASGSEANLMLTVPKGADDVLLHEDGTNGNVVTSWYANLPPGTSGSKVFYAEGVKKSSSVHGVGVRAMISGSAGMGVVNRGMTVAEVSVEAMAEFPTNKKRHVYGPAERTLVSVDPHVDVEYESHDLGSGTNIVDATGCLLTLPSGTSCPRLSIGNSGVVLSLPFEVVPPHAELRVYDCRMPTPDEWENDLEMEPFVAGEIGAVFHVGIDLHPNYVSFSELELFEGLGKAQDITGYFTNTCFNGHLNHGREQGAYRIRQVSMENAIGTGDNVFLKIDKTQVPPVYEGGFKVPIPLYWYVPDSGPTNLLVTPVQANDISVGADVEISKHGIAAVRGTNNVITIKRSERE